MTIYSHGLPLIIREDLKPVIEAQGGISKLTQHTDISPHTLATALSHAETELD